MVIEVFVHGIAGHTHVTLYDMHREYFVPSPRDPCPLRLVVRTLPFRGRNTGSTPVGDTDPHGTMVSVLCTDRVVDGGSWPRF